MGKVLLFKKADFNRNSLAAAKLYDGVTLLPYIQGDGASWIDTEVVISDHCIELDYRQSAYRTVTYFGIYDRVGANRTYFGVTTGGIYKAVFGGTAEVSITPPVLQTVDLERKILKFNTPEHYLVQDGEILYDASSDFVKNFAEQSLYIFCYNRYNVIPTTCATYRLYSAKVTDNTTGEIVCHLLPAKRDTDGAVGMYDVIAKRFRENKGSGRFITPNNGWL